MTDQSHEMTSADAAKRVSGTNEPLEGGSEPPMVSGKLVISTMVAVAVGLAAFAWWARYSASQQVLSVWGKDAVFAIRTGKQVELLRGVNRGVNQGEPGGPGGAFEFDEVIDISKTPGLIHARHHLIHQRGFDWDAQRVAGMQPTWEAGLRFTRKDQVATMLFDFDSSRAYLVENQTEVTMRPIIVDAMKKFLAGI